MSADAVAKDALLTFMELVDDGNSKDLGFDDRRQIKTATLGIPIRQFMVRLDDLKSYKSGKQARNMLHETEEILFPVEVNQRAVSSLTIGYVDDHWVARSFGGPNYIRILTDTRRKLAERESKPLEEYIEVRIPSLNLRFLGREAEGNVMLTPFLSNSRFGFETGQSLNADQVFSKLAPFVHEMGDLPS